MNKKTIALFGISFLTLALFFSFGNNSFQSTEALTSSDWIQCDAEPGEDVTGNSDDYHITGLKSFGRRVRTKEKYKIDGLSFEYVTSNFSASAGEKFNLNGFYFSNDTNAYVDPDNHSHNEAIYTFTSKLATSDKQDRFGIFAHHNIFEPGTNLANVKCYTSTDMSKKGFGYSDGTMICTHRSDDTTGFRFSFRKVKDTTLYKVTITELYSETMWQSPEYNVNYGNGKTFVYVDESSFNLDANGESYLLVYGYKTDNAPDTYVPDIHIKNLKVSSGYSVVFNTNGGSAVDSKTVQEGEKVTRPDDPTKEGNTFTGWFKDQTLSYLYDFNTPVYEDLVLFAGWNILTYTVTFDTNGIVTVQSKTVAYGNKVSKPTITYDQNAYEFKGWFTTNEYTTQFDFTNTLIKADTTIYGQFIKIGPSQAEITKNVIIISVSVGAGVIVIATIFIVIYQKKRKFALVKIEEVREKFKEKNGENNEKK